MSSSLYRGNKKAELHKSMTITVSLSATRLSHQQSNQIKTKSTYKVLRPVVFRPQLSMGLALAKIKKLPKRCFTLGS
jgi:hypothetical protein